MAGVHTIIFKQNLQLFCVDCRTAEIIDRSVNCWLLRMTASSPSAITYDHMISIAILAQVHFHRTHRPPLDSSSLFHRS